MNMTNLFREDADALQVSDDNLKAIAQLARRAKLLEKEVGDLEAVLKERQGQLRKITEETLPEALNTLGLRSFKMEDGSSIDVKEYYSASIPADRKAEAFAWLREHGYDDMIKNTVSVQFGRGEDEACGALISSLVSQGLPAEQAQKVEPMTLKAWVKEQMTQGNEVPSELFGVFVGQKATIKSK